MPAALAFWAILAILSSIFFFSTLIRSANSSTIITSLGILLSLLGSIWSLYSSIFLTSAPLSLVYLSSISLTAQLSMATVFGASQSISLKSMCGMPSKIVNSTCLGSTIIKRRSAGLYLYIKLTSKEFKPTLLPVPVEPAIRRCGILVISATTGSPTMFLPIAKVRDEGFAFTKTSLSSTSRSPTIDLVSLATSTPINGVFGIVAKRISLAVFSLNLRSSPYFIMFFMDTSSGISRSKRVMVGP